MKNTTTATFFALTCLSCNPLVTYETDAGIPDAGSEKDSGTQTSYVFEPENIIIADVACHE